jgi:DNA uptake protein ComE-like DNA-binding protein
MYRKERNVEDSTGRSDSMKIQGCIGIAGMLLAAAWFGAGCGDDAAERERKIHDEAAKAAAQAKPVVEEAGRAVKAAVDGAKEGWDKDTQKTLDLNEASEDDLTGLPGISKREARRIIAGRPYKEEHQLVSRRILTEAQYEKIKNDVAVK